MIIVYLVHSQVSDWAARALFLYGGEPRLLYAGGAQLPYGASGQQQQQQYLHHGGFQSPMGAGASTTAQYMGSPAPGGGYIASPPQASFHPNLMSTPASGTVLSTSGYGTPGGGGVNYTTQQQQQQTMPAEVQFSGRHNGLYLYVGRVLRPVWAMPLVCGPAEQPASQVEHARFFAKQRF